MRINRIRINGFKSFVDPTTLNLPGNLTGIVGPNGCGKSNIIDALTWVLGETSAKQLRGESMDDVIFNGSGGRQQVSKASVEIILDNSDGAVGDRYSNFAEIAVKRELVRDSQSNYSINGVRCRRKDVTDLFLGTGVGSRQYSVIGQGMVSRIVESKPEEMRGFLEEAAGISRYKDRRRETENKIKQTRVNIARINDLRNELQTQLNRLERQAREAKRYNKLKDEENSLQRKILAFRFTSLEKKRKELSVSKVTNEEVLAAINSEVLKVESAITEFTDKNEGNFRKLNDWQGEFYKHSAKISRLEEIVKQSEERKSEAIYEQEEIQKKIEEVRRDITNSAAALESVREELAKLAVKTQEEKDEVASDRLALSKNIEEASASGEQLKLLTNSHQELEKTLERLKQQLIHCRQNKESSSLTLSSIAEESLQLKEEDHSSALETAKTSLEAEENSQQELKQKRDDLRKSILLQRTKLDEETRRLHQVQKELEEERGRYSSLKTLQDSVHENEDTDLKAWFANIRMGELRRLVETVEIEAGWEVAFERAVTLPLNAYVRPNVVEDLKEKFSSFGDIPADITFIDSKEFPIDETRDRTLLSKVIRAPSVIKKIAAEIIIADSKEEIKNLLSETNDWSIAVAKDGTVVAPGWISICDKKNEKTNLILRENEIKRLKTRLGNLEKQILKTQDALNGHNAKSEQLHSEEKFIEEKIQEKELRVVGAKESYLELKAKGTQRAARLESIKLAEESAQAVLQKENEKEKDLMQNLSSTEKKIKDIFVAKQETAGKNQSIQRQTEASRLELQTKTEHLHSLEIQLQNLKAKEETLQFSILQNQKQEEELEDRKSKIHTSIRNDENSKKDEIKNIDSAFQKKKEIEQSLQNIKNDVSVLEQDIKRLNSIRKEKQSELDTLNAKLEEFRVEDRSLEVLQEELIRAAHKINVKIENTKDELSEDDSQGTLEVELEKVLKRIERLGPLNLAAIEEFSELELRKKHFDSQNEDLEKALENLIFAIRKIDNETKARFKDIYDKVNDSITSVFSKLFGGGSARLVLTDQDILETGVSILARPPGKRNTNISQLSGGEKALTALSVIFTIFSLKPSPFCLLDEVDAPLDDSNVIRYAEMIAEMSKSVQFLFVSHNKLTMEIADQLIGVTMEEPGVSRMVSVDVPQALQLVESA